MNWEFQHKIKRLIKHLPTYNAKNESWSSIENYLEFSEMLNGLKTKMPVHSAPPQIWETIDVKPVTKTLSTFKLFAIAASFLFIITTAWFTTHLYLKKNLNRSSETVYDFKINFPATADSTETAFLTFLNEHCNNNNYVCNDQEFSLKKKELEEIRQEIDKIDQIISQRGTTSSLVKTRIQLENYKTQLIMDLVKKITS